MMRTIDAALLESKINEFVADDVNDIKHQQHREGAKYAVKRIRKIIQDVHTLDVQPVVHAYWIELPKALNPNENPCKCSNCGRILSFYNHYPKSKYCDECGAKMDKEKSNEKTDN